jgi:hypothetical protein
MTFDAGSLKGLDHLIVVCGHGVVVAESLADVGNKDAAWLLLPQVSRPNGSSLSFFLPYFLTLPSSALACRNLEGHSAFKICIAITHSSAVHASPTHFVAHVGLISEGPCACSQTLFHARSQRLPCFARVVLQLHTSFHTLVFLLPCWSSHPIALRSHINIGDFWVQSPGTNSTKTSPARL